MGGVQALFIRLAEFLQNECDVFVLEASSRSCFCEFLWRDKVTFIKFCFRRVVLPSDAVVVMTPADAVLCGYMEGENIRFLFWDLHLRVHSDVGIFRFLALLEKRCRLGLEVKTRKFLMRLISPTLYSRLEDFFKTVNKKQGLICMTNEGYRSSLDSFDIKIQEKVVPLCVELGDFVEPNLNADYIRVCWLGRFCDFKYPPIESIIEELHKFCRKCPKKSVHLDLVGFGNYENKIRRDCERCALDNFFTEIKGVIKGKALEVYLKNSVDLVCAHGTSVLEGARFGIPSVICCGGYDSKEAVTFLWLYKARESCLGELRGFGGEKTLEGVLNELLRSPKTIARKCYEHVAKYYDMTVVVPQFLSAVQETEVTLEDIKKTKITKNTFLKKVDYLRINFPG
jgi:hypothetical protein